MKRLLPIALFMMTIVPCYGLDTKNVDNLNMLNGITNNAEARKKEIDELVKLIDTTIEVKMAQFKIVYDQLMVLHKQYTNGIAMRNQELMALFVTMRSVEDRVRYLCPQYKEKFDELAQICDSEKPKSPDA